MLVFKDQEVVALLPANKVENTLWSHQGLSYGGLILNQATKLADVLDLFKVLLETLLLQGIETIELKLVPKIYHKLPSDEMDYLLFKLQAQLVKAETLSVVKPKSITLSRDRKQGLKRASKNGLVVKEVDRFDAFWNDILIPNLADKHDTQPVHNLQEITYLKNKFPQNIRQFNVYKDDQIVAGTTIFETELVAHSQYISGNEDKNLLGSLDVLHHHLLTEIFQEKPYFDFGSSNENNGQHINKGLNYWKEGFGARTIVHSSYRIETRNFQQLNSVWI